MTVNELVESQGDALRANARLEQARKRLTDAEAKLRRQQAAIEAGVDPSALVDPINAAQAERNHCAGRTWQHAAATEDADLGRRVPTARRDR